MTRMQSFSAQLRARAAFVAALALAISLQASGAWAQGEAVRIPFFFTMPIYAAAPLGDARLFVVERAGIIRVVQNGAVLPTAFLDITDRVGLPSPVPSGFEGGLLGLVFAPEFAQSGVFFVYYTHDDDPSEGFAIVSRVARFTAADPASSDAVDAASETIVFQVEQPFINHKGGTVAIREGYLYLGLGDGGSGGDPGERAQDDTSLLGKMLRFDLAQQGLPWTPEVWAKGFRNPFRFSFDRANGDLYVGDVGESTFEEINVERADSPGSLNYGWDVMEGTGCHPDGAADPGELPCFDPAFVDPVYEFENGLPDACAVTGGSRSTGVPSRRRCAACTSSRISAAARSGASAGIARPDSPRS